MSKSQKKKLKKQKLNSGESAPVNGNAKEHKGKETEKESSEKKVQFKSKLEEGPAVPKSNVATPQRSNLSPQAKSETKPTPEKKVVTLANGVVVEEHVVGTGKKAKKGSKLGIRYIGKLKNGKEFDKNTKGSPFRFTLGKGEVIKGTFFKFVKHCWSAGWDIGLDGIQIGGERKIHIPAAVAYGSKSLPGIPANSDLVFDVKCVSMNWY